MLAAGAAAYVATQLTQGGSAPAGGASAGASTSISASASPARGQAAPAKAAIEAGLKEAFGAPGQALVSARVAASPVAGMQPGVTPSGEQTRTTTDQVPAEDGKPAGTRSTTVTTRVEGSGSRRTVFTDFRISERRGDSGFNLRGKLTSTLNVCPDAEGLVPFDIDLQASGDNQFGNVAGTGGFSVNFSARGNGRATVDDSATLTGYRREIGGDYSIRGGENLSGESDGGTGEAKMRIATDGSLTIGSASTVSIETRSGGMLGVGIGDSRIETASTGGSAPQ